MDLVRAIDAEGLVAKNPLLRVLASRAQFAVSRGRGLFYDGRRDINGHGPPDLGAGRTCNSTLYQLPQRRFRNDSLCLLLA
jgi:hypothetical protein